MKKLEPYFSKAGKTMLYCLLFYCFPFIIAAQNPNHFECTIVEDTIGVSATVTGGGNLSIYGKDHTPRGNLKALIVYAGFKDHAGDEQRIADKTEKALNGWINNYSTNYQLPSYLVWNPTTNQITTHPFLFNRPEDFEAGGPIDDEDNRSSSRIVNIMSKPNQDFRLYGDIFTNPAGEPVLVTIDPFVDENTGQPYQYAYQVNKHFNKLNAKVVKKMQEINPNFDWSQYDQRTNKPSYEYDNSDPSLSGPDGAVDYLIFVYRYDRNWDIQPQIELPISPNNPSLKTISIAQYFGSGGGFNVIGSGDIVYGNNQQNSIAYNTGFTAARGGGIPNALFLHEMAHSLYSCPHFGSANNVCGKYFYVPSVAWGATPQISMFEGYNAWERWYLGYITPQEPSTDELLQLNDFVTAGDAIRIEIPFSEGQHLWIENRMGIDRLDEHNWWKQGQNPIGPTENGELIKIPNSANGVYMFVENIATDHTVFGLSPVTYDGANGIKMLNASGNWDFEVIPEAAEIYNGWGGKLYQYDRKSANPIAGMNPWLVHRAEYSSIHPEEDWEDPDRIAIDTDFNSAGSRNEGIGIDRELADTEDAILYRSLGGQTKELAGYNRSPAFKEGDVLGMGTNPMILNYPKYDTTLAQFSPFYLNGLSVSINHIATDGTAEVEVKYKQTLVEEHVRWTGNIVLPNITEDAAADLVLGADKKLTLDLSATANRHTRHPALGGFVNPSILTISSGSKLHLKERSNLTIKAHSQLIIEEGAEILLEEGACIVIEADGHLLMKGNNIHMNGAQSVIIVKGELATADNVDFSFTGAGYAKFYNTHSLNLGSNSNFALERSLDKAGKKFLELKENTVLSIVSRSLRLKYGNIEYEGESRIQLVNTPIEALAVDFLPVGNGLSGGDIAIESFVTEGIPLSKIEYCHFSKIPKGLHMEKDASLSADVVLHLKSNTFETMLMPLKLKNIDYVEFSRDEFHQNQDVIQIENSFSVQMDQVIISNNANTACVFKAVDFVNINRSTIHNSYFGSGIEAERSNIFLDAGTVVSGHRDYGVVFVNNELANYALTVGGYGCASIVNNGLAGVAGENLILNIDAIEHAFNNGNPDDPLANRFDGNGPNGTGPIFHICYTDPSIDANEIISMKGNYWGGESIDAYEYYFMLNGCPNVPLTNNIGVDASNYISDLDQLVDCSLIMNVTPTANPSTPVATVCELEVNGVLRKVQEQSQNAWQKLIAKDYSQAREKYLPVASLNTSVATYENICTHKIRFARCMVEAIEAPAQARLLKPTKNWDKETEVVRDLLKNKDFVIVPNPATNYLRLLANEKTMAAKIQLHNAMGKVMKNIPYKSEMYIDLREFKAGIYFLNILDREGKVLHKEKLIIQ